ncbi:4-hydroxybenzoyl-CoA reductase subunit beta [Magnetospirillum sp. LM-5]|uniref:4-hydroxybenzoyl-CoA reductase subunit beta n=1 Tax=Magnetospirillum sp. LM-5 TaxID=2681466 RepID=UPI001384763A|nr:4-hydroxybenzoyl-CoA reductase subunit beta [Magnetospirillum sp. LM-5]CAA7616815.1 4-hydroxybenzoyl-CoA reductase subunit beta [Magnetospirillum sp. LM-5]
MNLMPDLKTVRPASLPEACKALTEAGAHAVAGGTDLVPNLRRGLLEPAVLVDLTALEGFAAIEPAAEGGLRLGAGVTLEAIAENPDVLATYPGLAQAALGVAGPTHRAAATLGGNLCQDTRCVFYNQSEWWREGNGYCLKLKGDKCHVVVKSDRCYATYHGDVAPALMVLGATAEIAGPIGKRTLPLGQLFVESGAAHLALNPGEIVCAIHLPPADGLRSAYEKARVRDAVDFPLAGIAVSLRKDGATIAALKVAVTGTNSAPVMVPTDGLIGKAWDGDAAKVLTESVRKTSLVLKTTVMGAKYRRRVAQGLAKRLIDRLWED